ncbi:MAG: DUF2970 domain-containing protein [Thiogranum sp.]|nr:DUF2970 domain-containing protein [Thiogranum sp.]
MSYQDKPPTQRKQSLFSVFRSVAASMFGVQSSSKHQEDFGHGKASTYIAVGLISTIVFVFMLWGLVQLVVRLTQPG